MTEHERLERILRELNLPLSQWLISGSGVMVLHRLERPRPMGDVDIFAATRLWFQLYNTGDWSLFTTDPNDRKRRCDPPYLFRDVQGLEVNIFCDWRRRSVGDIDVAFWINNAECVAGWPCLPLQLLLDWKEQVGRAKDADDIAILRKALS